jgi:hypothetical protein
MDCWSYLQYAQRSKATTGVNCESCLCLFRLAAVLLPLASTRSRTVRVPRIVRIVLEELSPAFVLCFRSVLGTNMIDKHNIL